MPRERCYKAVLEEFVLGDLSKLEILNYEKIYYFDFLNKLSMVKKFFLR